MFSLTVILLCFSEILLFVFLLKSALSVLKFLLFFTLIHLKSGFSQNWGAKSPCFSETFYGLRPSSVVSVGGARVTGEFFALAARDEAEKLGLVRV